MFVIYSFSIKRFFFFFRSIFPFVFFLARRTDNILQDNKVELLTNISFHASLFCLLPPRTRKERQTKRERSFQGGLLPKLTLAINPWLVCLIAINVALLLVVIQFKKSSQQVVEVLIIATVFNYNFFLSRFRKILFLLLTFVFQHCSFLKTPRALNRKLKKK